MGVVSGQVVVFALSVLGLLGCLVLAAHRARGGWGAGAFFLALFGIFYFLVPAYLSGRDLLGDPFEIKYVRNPGLLQHDSVVPFLLCALFLFAFLLACPGPATPPRLGPAASFREVRLLGRQVRLVVIGAILIGPLAWWGLVYYIRSYGGFTEAVAVAAFVRAGYGSEYQVGDNVFSYRFADVAFVALAGALATRSRVLQVASVVAAIPFFVYVGALAKGKANFLALALVPFLYWSITRQRSYLRLSAVIGAATLVAVPLAQAFIFADIPSLTLEEIRPTTESIVQYLAHPYESVLAAVNYDGDFLYLNDFVAGLRGQIVPMSWLTDLAPWSSIEVNTAQVMLAFERTIPPGPVAFGYYAWGVPGVVLWGAALGGVAGWLDDLISRNRGNAAVMYLSACLLFIFSNAIYHGVPEFIFYMHRTVMCLLVLAACFRYRPAPAFGADLAPAPGTATQRAG